jgi:hypothetical protein
MAYYALKVARGERELLTDYSGTSEDYFHKTASIEFNQTIFSCHERNVDITPALLQRYGIQENKKNLISALNLVPTAISPFARFHK